MNSEGAIHGESARARFQLLAGTAPVLLAGDADVEGTLAELARLVVPQFADWCVVHLVDGEGELRRVALEHADPARARRVAHATGRFRRHLSDATGIAAVMRSRQPWFVPDVTDEDLTELAADPRRRRVLRALGLTSYLVVPMESRGQLFGTMSFAFAESGRRYTRDDLLLAEELAARAALAVDNLRLLRELHAERSLVESLLAEAPIGLAFIDRERRYLRVSASLARMNAHTVDEHLGRTTHEILPASLADFLETYFDRVFENGEAAVNHETSAVLPGNDLRHVLFSFYPLRDPSGRIVMAGAIVVDITERKKAEHERALWLVRERQARERAELAARRSTFLAQAGRVLSESLDYATTLRNLAQLAVPAIADCCLIDLVEDDGSVRRVALVHRSPEAQKRLGMFTFGPLLRTSPIYTAIATGHAQLTSHITESHLRSIAPGEVRAQIGDLAPRSIMIVPLRARARTFGAITFVSAESGRAYAEDDLAMAEELVGRAELAVDNARLYREAQAAIHEAEEANRAKDQFLATVSHELRTPLSAILGWAYLLRTRSMSEEARARAVGTIERNARVQAQLVDDILDVSRIISGKLRLHTRPIDLGAVLTAALDAVRPAAEAKEIALTIELAAAPRFVTADGARLQQVIWNLLSNAIKFTPKDGRVSITATRAGSNVELAVRDDGVGISREFLPHVFERFRQLDGSTTRQFGGLGLGLAIVRHLVELHGGTVRAESEGPGRGARFVVSLPLRAVQPAEAAPDDDEHAAAAGATRADDLGGLRVLVVDDDADARELISFVLSEQGAEVRVTSSAKEALPLVESWRPSVMLSDIGMPEESGYDLIRAVRALGRERGGWVPSVALTAYAHPDDRRRALLAGYQLHLPKPITAPSLVSAVARLARWSEDIG